MSFRSRRSKRMQRLNAKKKRAEAWAVRRLLLRSSGGSMRKALRSRGQMPAAARHAPKAAPSRPLKELAPEESAVAQRHKGFGAAS
jgi:hypothetical protein